MRASIKKHGRKIFLTFLILVVLGWITGYFSVYLLPRKSFESPEELISFVGKNSNTLWRGTRYVGDQYDRSLFFHREVRHLILEIPADSWDLPKRFQLTVNRGRWIEWYQCFPREEREE